MTYKEASSAAVAVAIDVDSTRMWMFALVVALLLAWGFVLAQSGVLRGS
jgi:hypothetical protein